MSFAMLKRTKTFGGKTYNLAGRYYEKSDAEAKAKWIRGRGGKARISQERIMGAPPWAVWAR